MTREFYEFVFRLRSSGFQHHTQASARRLMEGMPVDGASVFSELDGERGSLSDSAFRDMRNFLIGACFMSAQILIERGADAEYAYSLSDYYINRLDTVRDRRAMDELFLEMLDSAAELEQQRREGGLGTLIGDCVRFIDQKLYGRLSAADVAAHIGMNASYLSSLFREKTGLPLHRYILRRKIEEGKTMLSNTRRSVSEIADALGFSSPAHFCAEFRKQEGITPTRFREQS